MQEYLLVFDIETIPDTEAVINLLGKDIADNWKDITDLQAVTQQQRQALSDYHLEITDGKNAFLRQPFHRVIVISYALVAVMHNGKQEQYTLKQLRSGGDENSSEEDLIKGFFNTIAKYKPRLISFNGRTFDVPVLKYRAMKYGIAAEAFYNVGDKWSNYGSRYSFEWCCDLLEALSDFGSSARIKLNEVCSIMGFPGKFGVDGGAVSDLFDNNRIKEIRDYCETDVLNTYLVYLRYMQHLGKLSKANYNQAIEEVLEFIETSPDKIHLTEFKMAWQDSSKGKFTL